MSPTDASGPRPLFKRTCARLLRVAALLTAWAGAIRRYTEARTPRRGKRLRKEVA